MARRRPPGTPWRNDPLALQPMLAQGETIVFDPATFRPDPRLVYEPKYDGMRALVELIVQPQRGPRGRGRGGVAEVRIWSRLGHDKAEQFPELVGAFETLARAVKRPLVLDGEIVAIGPDGRPAGFEKLQARLHLAGAQLIAQAAARQPVAFVAFDLLRDDREDLRPLALAERRARLARILKNAPPAVRLSPQVPGSALDPVRWLSEGGGEGLVAKDPASPYESGRRSRAWRKLKRLHRQEFIVGGWTEPRGTRRYFGALLVGLPADGGEAKAGGPTRLVAVGHVGTGFSDEELERLGARLQALETSVCPFIEPLAANQRAHWVRPELVVEVQFQAWTEDGQLRAPVFVGLRTDVRPEEVRREEPPAPARPPQREAARSAKARPTGGESATGSRTSPEPDSPARLRVLGPLGSEAAAAGGATPPALASELDALIERVHDLEARRRDGVVTLPEGGALRLTNLGKVFWPALKLTKGDLVRYYLRVAPYILPVVADRPLVMQRFPDGIEGEAFYQQRAPERPPQGVRVEVVEAQGERVPRVIGGSLGTLLYMVQLATISQDPWFSRVGSPEAADFAALDLDPMPGVGFQQVLDVARWIFDELDRLGVPAAAKTSGARGLHIFIPLPPGTSYESSLLFCQLVATLVAAKHPEAATVERAVAARGRTVYLDYLQNLPGKTLAAAYSPRATPFAGVSTPLARQELDEGIDPRDFTMTNVPARLATYGDRWAAVRTGPRADLRAALDRLRALLG